VGRSHHGRVQALHLVDRLRAPRLRLGRHTSEQLGHLAVDRLLGGAESGRHLFVAETFRHHVQDRAILVGRVVPAGEPCGDGGVDRAAARVHLADRARQLVALGDVVLQQIRQTAVAAAEQGQGVGFVVVRGQDHDAGVRMLRSDRVRAVDALQLERGGHLDVGHHDVGLVLLGCGEQRRGVLGHPHDLDVVIRVQERAHAFAYQHVVLTQDDPDAHAAISFRAGGTCTIRR
jgi:hypothetical protein